MFQNWGFLITEMIVLLILAVLLGLLVGWLIWGRRDVVSTGAGDTRQLAADLDRCRSMHVDKDDKIAALEAELTALRMAQEDAAQAPTQSLTSMAAPAMASDPRGAPNAPTDPVEAVQEEAVDAPSEGTKPAALEAAREGGADDLKRIKGIGPKLEILCNSLGFYHFDQIAAWTESEVAWVDENLEGFKGRVSRDKWVDQARRLADGEETEFSKRVDKGDVYQ